MRCPCAKVVEETYANYVACRLAAIEHLRTASQQMHSRIDKLKKHTRSLAGTDPTWILDDAWLQQHGLAVLKDAWHAAVLKTLPSQEHAVVYDEAPYIL